MPLIRVVNGVARYSIESTLLGKPHVNVMDIKIDTTGSVLSRAECVEEQATILRDEWASEVLPLLVDDLVLTGVSWVDIDDTDGSTGSVGVSGVPDTSGDDAGAPLVPNTAALVKKLTTSQRGHRNGRMYIGGLNETLVSAAGIIDVTFAGTLQAGLDAFKTDSEQDGSGPGGWSSQFVVTHFPPIPDPIPSGDTTFVGESSVVSALQLDPIVATQRRRLRS